MILFEMHVLSHCQGQALKRLLDETGLGQQMDHILNCW